MRAGRVAKYDGDDRTVARIASRNSDHNKARGLARFDGDDMRAVINRRLGF